MASRKTHTSKTGGGAASGRAAAPPQTTLGDTLGVRLKHARRVHQLTLKALAGQVGCSESLLSKVESGQATPSLATLHRLALALSTNIAELVSGPDINASPVQRANERPSVSFPTAGKRGSILLERLVVPAPGRLMQGDIHVIEPRSSSDEQISHAGEELGYVIEGQLELRLDAETYLLEPGDSFYFPSKVPHSYRNPGKVVTRVLWVNSPPTF